ncbi:putative porin [Flavobacterium capsici]|uniref:Porin n=1 Tax=Flavobacterium capsici TaxID=3075618 RepID=A0AA96EXV6_9FLAO|nr:MULTISPECIES: putative porin [unclassified Flavobacterium]WNM19067.1 putative porin [Flavobacterium sp. PMR2A8]WNM20456.1 putative porin [Flavobacterium sp. PMTSA4]
MKKLLFTFFLLVSFSINFAQGKKKILENKREYSNEEKKSSTSVTKSNQSSSDKASIDKYRIISIQKDTTYVDTSLTIQKDYKWNYLRKDIFGLLPFANEGQTYAILDYGLKKKSSFPEIGFSGKHFNYLGVNDINYYSVATPITELYFKTTMQQGQSLDALITVNTSERFNFSVAFKGLRSLGRYINQLTSAGNFRFTSSYNTLNKRYYLNFHFTGQDLLNGENGGLTNVIDFTSENPDFDNRERLEVYLRDAESFLKGKRYFIDHSFRINSKDSENNLYATHQFNYETKFFEYKQPTIASTVGNTSVKRFGDAYVTSGLKDQTRFNRMYNKVGAIYENKTLGKFQFFAEDFRYNYYYDRVLILESGVIPSKISQEINTIGGQYEYRKNKWNGVFTVSNSISKQPMSNIDAKLNYKLNDKNEFTFNYQLMSKIPDASFNLYQSDFINYNWSNNFDNEKINSFGATAKTQWITASLEVSSLNDHLFFSNDSTDGQQQLITPKQYDKTINYLSIKASREFKWWKLALDNTILYQQVDQEDDVLNVPQIVTRNSLYFTDYFFKKALFLQTGFTVNYFSKYYINDYNPVIAEAFVQNDLKVGNFPMIDFFINARIRQTRIFLKAEHFNSKMTGNNFLTAPNYPYRDFTIRFGLIWNFFQ